MARVLVCLDPVPASDGSCAESAWLEQQSVLPPLTVEEGKDIAGAALLAFAVVMAVKVALRKSQ
jgi:hypothetical protein